MSKNDVYIVSAARTAVGSFNGALSGVPATELGSIAIKAAVERAGLPSDAIDECFMGHVLTGSLGQAPARQALLGAGIDQRTPCTTIGKVCGSGLQAVILAARGLMVGDGDVSIGGGMENMTATAYALPKARNGYRMGNGQTIDMMVNDGLWDVYNNLHMGSCADAVAAEENVTREQQDDFSVASYQRARKATADGTNKWEIAPVEVPQRKGDPKIFDVDEGPQVFNEQKMRGLRPAFNRKDGTVTAGNASSINDGGAAFCLATEEGIKKHGLTPLARIVSWGFGAREPKRFPLAPVLAVEDALKKADLEAKDINFWEINEAFAVVTLLAMREFELDLDIVNPLGGAVSIGHPIGASGARILTTLVNTLKINKAKYGLATLCIGGGEGNALIIERV